MEKVIKLRIHIGLNAFIPIHISVKPNPAREIHFTIELTENSTKCLFYEVKVLLEKKELVAYCVVRLNAICGIYIALIEFFLFLTSTVVNLLQIVPSRLFPGGYIHFKK